MGGRRRRRWREPGYAWWIAFGVLLIVAALATSWRLALIALAGWCLYEFSLNPTACRIRTREGHICRQPIRGRLFACSAAHQELKNDALWRATGLRNPFRRRAAHDPNGETGVVVYSPPVRARVARDDLTILGLAALGSVASIVGTVIGLFNG
jgi:hypothetical protein